MIRSPRLVYLQHHSQSIPLTIQTARDNPRIITPIKPRNPQNIPIRIPFPSPLCNLLSEPFWILRLDSLEFPEYGPEPCNRFEWIAKIVTITGPEKVEMRGLEKVKVYATVNCCAGTSFHGIGCVGDGLEV